MRKIVLMILVSSAACLAGCANTAQNEADLAAAYDVAAAAEQAYAADPSANPDTVKQAAALLASAQAAFIAWQNAPAGSTTEATALSAAIAALVAFEAQIGQSAATQHAARECDPTNPFCDDGVHRG